jgi:uncharacterized protein YndB with AHSA1/START domain
MTATPDPTKLQLALDGDTDIIVRRDFNHAPALVWRGLTEPALIRQWMAIKDFPMTRCEMDPRPGGAFHFEWAGADGRSFFFHGPILKVDAPHHLAHVEHFSGDPSYRTDCTTDLEAQGSGTRMTMVMRYATAIARDAALAGGMIDGMEETYANLDALLTV